VLRSSSASTRIAWTSLASMTFSRGRIEQDNDPRNQYSLTTMSKRVRACRSRMARLTAGIVL
jgi:hypothetical protein